MSLLSPGGSGFVKVTVPVNALSPAMVCAPVVITPEVPAPASVIESVVVIGS